VLIEPVEVPMLVVGSAPFQPSEPVPPVAVHPVAFALTHVSRIEPPV
jgi:hypothetical protein